MMAYATQITISTGSKVSVNYQSQEVHVGVTYQLEREDENLLQLVESKAAEVEAAHRRLWKTLKAERAAINQKETANPNGGHSSSDDSSAGYQENGYGNGSHGNNGYSENGHNGNGYHSGPHDEMVTEAQERAVFALTRKMQLDPEEVERTLRMRFDKNRLQELTKRQASQFIDELQRKQRMKTRQ